VLRESNSLWEASPGGFRFFSSGEIFALDARKQPDGKQEIPPLAPYLALTAINRVVV